ncbi:MAG: HEAT repeat domain-containing protein [Candidatus Dormibacteria bacterium]
MALPSRLHTRDAVGSAQGLIRQNTSWGADPINDHETVPALIERLGDEDPRVREAVAWALSMIADPTAVPALIQQLGDEDPGVRRAVAHALGSISDRKAVPALIERLGAEDQGVRWAVAWSLVAYGTQRQWPTWCAGCSPPSPTRPGIPARSIRDCTRFCLRSSAITWGLKSETLCSRHPTSSPWRALPNADTLLPHPTW